MKIVVKINMENYLFDRNITAIILIGQTSFLLDTKILVTIFNNNINN